MDQPTFADLEYQGKKRKTRRELFPWSGWMGSSRRLSHALSVMLDAAVREVRRAVELIRASLSIAAIDYLLFEFSWYRVPVGCQNERLIFWELATSASQEDALERLLLANC